MAKATDFKFGAWFGHNKFSDDQLSPSGPGQAQVTYSRISHP